MMSQNKIYLNARALYLYTFIHLQAPYNLRLIFRMTSHALQNLHYPAETTIPAILPQSYLTTRVNGQSLHGLRYNNLIP